MSMDALTTATFDALVKKMLPALAKRLASLQAVTPANRKPDGDLKTLVNETQELLALLSRWLSPQAAATTAPDSKAPGAKLTEELSDDEVMHLLAAESLPGSPENPLVKPASSLPIDRQPPSVGVDASEELSDDEAMALLSQMQSDDAPASASLKNNASANDMSDADAHALLAQMDAPLAAPAPDASMSDDIAKALLAEMDAPLAPAAAKPKAANTAAAPAAPAADPAGDDEDEALKMLKAMGGFDGAEENAAVPPAAPAVARPVASAPTPTTTLADADDDEADLAEIDEFSKNDFSSDPDMLNDFNSNCDEIMETLNTTILQLEQTPEDRETIESIFRAAHTLKGAAGMFGFKAIERVMHRMENLFDLVRKGKLVPNGDTIDVVFQGIDVLRTLLDAVKQGKPSGIATIPIVKALTKAAKGQYVKGQLSDTGGAASKTAAATPSHDAQSAEVGQDEEAKAKTQSRKNEQASTIRVDLERLDALVNLVGELVIDRTRFATIEEDIRSSHPQLKMTSNLSETVQLFGRHMNEIHEIIMKIRMVPIGNAFNKFTRIVRDLSRQLGKEIELYIDGETTELDKTLVEQIGDPLIHLIRNACDHGIEKPDVRQAAGKPRSGRVFLSARQEGNHIILTIEDDGKGMNADVIRKKAIERGLISDDQTLSHRDILNLIFEPGFSTAEKVTEVSGRGVGMDVVRKQIAKLKGIIDLNSEFGKGSNITIQLPLTLAIVQSLLIESRGECFAIPLSAVVESVRIRPEDIQRVGDAEVIKRHGHVLPLMHLDDILNLKTKHANSWYTLDKEVEPDKNPRAAAKAASHVRRKERLFVVIVGTGERRFGIIVDQLLNQQEMVIKSLGKIMHDTPCVAGGAVLGNGEVVLVVDVQELEDHFRTKSRGLPAA